MSTPYDYFQYHDQILHCEDVPLQTIVRSIGSPVYVYSSQAFLSTLGQLKTGLQGLDSTICFAVKSNSNLSILKLLTEAGAGMDIVSGGELYRANLAGATPDKTVFSGVGKTAAEMSTALKWGARGIFSFNVESSEELSKLNQIAIEMGKKARVALRFNPDVDAKTHPYISTGLKKNKFGMYRPEILKVAHHLDQFKGIEFQGISLHIGSQLLSLAPLRDAFKLLRNLVDELDAILPNPISSVDLGGGIGITYEKEKTPPIKEYCALIQKYFGQPLKILIEPGRSLSGNAGALVTEVLFRKNRQRKDFLIIDAGMNDLIRPALYGSHHEIVPLTKKSRPSRNNGTTKMDVVGPVCESSDCFGSNRIFPQDLKNGDHVAILSSGAYGFSMSSNYNSRPRPPEVLVQNGNFKVIRRRETYEDLVRGETSHDLGEGL